MPTRLCCLDVDTDGRVPGVALVLSMSGSNAFKCQTRRGGAFAQGKRQCKHAVSIRCIGTDRVDRHWKGHFARVCPDVPLVEEALLAIVFLEHAA